VVHGGVAAVLDPPRIRAAFHADSADGMWTLESVGRALSGLSSSAGFACEDTLALATETIGFPPATALRRAGEQRDRGGEGVPSLGPPSPAQVTARFR
jgi:hypothetical protein